MHWRQINGGSTADKDSLAPAHERQALGWAGRNQANAIQV